MPIGNYFPEVKNYVSDFRRAVRERDGPAIMGLAGDGLRRAMLPVGLYTFIKAASGDVPDSMVTQSLTGPAFVFGIGEGLRSAGYIWGEAKNRTLNAAKVAGSIAKAAMPFWVAYNNSNGSDGAVQAISDTFVPSLVYGILPESRTTRTKGNK